MLQVKNCSKVLAVCVLCSVLCALTSCENPDPFTTQGNVENPNWTVTVENDMTASMTAVVKVSFTSQPGTLAAFIGDDCCGVAEYKPEYGLYWLYMSKDQRQETNDQRPMTNDIQLRFYSPDLKRIFVATSTYPFHNETNLGTIADPLTPAWKVAE